jgi:glycerol-3-phosphate dehydrogenase
MKRDPGLLSGQQFDVMVIGGGVLGACVLRDAALRGLRAALVEREDFAAETSANSLKVIHGGLRYLQQLNIRRVRESSIERSTWLRVAPHLIEPLPVVVPSFSSGLDRRSILRAGVAVNDVFAWDRNRGVFAERHLPASRGLSRSEVTALVPELAAADPTGGVLFYDAQMYNAERLVLEIVLSAVEAGCVAVNHIEVDGPLLSRGNLIGVELRDCLNGGRTEVRASVIVNTTGPSTSSLAQKLVGKPPTGTVRLSVALNLVVPALGHTVAFSIREATHAGRRGRKLFVVPWRGRSMIGTAHYPFSEEPAHFTPRETEVERFLSEVNAAWPGRPLTRADVLLVHAGLVPDVAGSGEEPAFLERHQVIDHAVDGTPSLISAVSGKFTTGRLAAEEVVDLVFRKLGRRSPPCSTAQRALPGAPDISIAELTALAARRVNGELTPAVIDHLVRTYGARHERVLAYRQAMSDWNQPVPDSEIDIRAQFALGVEEEMAVTPGDLVYRRTEHHAIGHPESAALTYADQVLRSYRRSVDDRQAQPVSSQ